MKVINKIICRYARQPKTMSTPFVFSSLILIPSTKYSNLKISRKNKVVFPVIFSSKAVNSLSASQFLSERISLKTMENRMARKKDKLKRINSLYLKYILLRLLFVTFGSINQEVTFLFL